MSYRQWSLEDIPWARFDASLIDRDIVPLVKAASLVEYNADDYVSYLCRVFDDDPAFCDSIRQWGREEAQHGAALGRWAELADAGFDFRASFQRFRAAYRIPVDAQRSVRGSRAGELVARCVVEIGTSSIYSALRDAAAEPVLADLCDRIAKDEYRHYGMFLKTLQRHGDARRFAPLRRAMVAYQRFNEFDDDELALAFHCANTADRPYDRRQSHRTCARSLLTLYRRDNVDRATAMALKAAGFRPRGRLSAVASNVAWRLMQQRKARLDAA